jgi:hypothetical protein
VQLAAYATALLALGAAGLALATLPQAAPSRQADGAE